MPSCPSCQQPASKRNGFDRRGRQKYACGTCRSTFTENSISVFSGYRWAADVILTAVRWYVDEVFLFRKGQKRYLYRAIEEDGVVVDVLLREHGDTASAKAFFRQAIERTGVVP